MKKGIKRFVLLMLLLTSPMVWAEPISPLQGVYTKVSKAGLIEVAAVKKVPAKKSRNVIGIASWYSETDPAINKHTANGEVFDDTQKTCASWYHPFNTLLKVTNLENGKSVVCRVNDRGPAKRLNRVVDLAKGAFIHIASPRKGLVRVSVRPVGKAK